MTQKKPPRNIRHIRNKRVLVTGAAGFIGSHLVERLVRMGARVRAFIHYDSEKNIGNLQYLSRRQFNKIEFVTGELRDPESVRDAVRDSDIVFHLGAIISVPYSFENPRGLVETNILGTLNIVNAARSAKCRVVHTSSSEVYGTARSVPMTEDHPLQAQSPYAASKIGADKIVESYVSSYGVDAVTLRPFNTYGPRQSTRAIIPTIITQSLASSTLRLGNLDPVRDFVYVSDTVDGFIRISDPRVRKGTVVHIGTGVKTSIRGIIDIVGRLTSRQLRTATDRRRLRAKSSEVDELCASYDKARSILNWRPRVDIQAGIGRTIAWLRQHRASSTEYRI